MNYVENLIIKLKHRFISRKEYVITDGLHSSQFSFTLKLKKNKEILISFAQITNHLPPSKNTDKIILIFRKNVQLRVEVALLGFRISKTKSQYN